KRCARRCVERLPGCPHQVDRSRERATVDHDLDQIVVPYAPDGTAVQCLGSDVADAGAAGEPGKTTVREQRDVLAPREIAERGGDLRGLLHPRARRTVADQ